MKNQSTPTHKGTAGFGLEASTKSPLVFHSRKDVMLRETCGVFSRWRFRRCFNFTATWGRDMIQFD